MPLPDLLRINCICCFYKWKICFDDTFVSVNLNCQLDWNKRLLERWVYCGGSALVSGLILMKITSCAIRRWVGPTWRKWVIAGRLWRGHFLWKLCCVSQQPWRKQLWYTIPFYHGISALQPFDDDHEPNKTLFPLYNECQVLTGKLINIFYI